MLDSFLGTSRADGDRTASDRLATQGQAGGHAGGLVSGGHRGHPGVNGGCHAGVHGDQAYKAGHISSVDELDKYMASKTDKKLVDLG